MPEPALVPLKASPSPGASPSPTPGASPTPPPSPTPSPEASPTPSPGASPTPSPTPSPSTTRQKILIFDSGLGGLSVYREIRLKRKDAEYLYLADDARFPYGALAPDTLVAGVVELIAQTLADFAADALVIACNTASTLVLPPLRARFALPVIGTVPAIKPAAQSTHSRLVSVLATAGTVQRDYTAELIKEHAQGVDVTLVGASGLAGLVEQILRGESVADAAIAQEIAPAFIEKPDPSGALTRTDHVVLACTHYPLIIERLERLAPWPVTWVDPAPAIARRVVQVLGPAPSFEPAAGEGTSRIRFTQSAPLADPLGNTLKRFGFTL